MLGVWFIKDPKLPEMNETEQSWIKTLTIGGDKCVDLIYTDYPQDVKKLFEKYQYE